jgi:hypothetical protein
LTGVVATGAVVAATEGAAAEAAAVAEAAADLEDFLETLADSILIMFYYVKISLNHFIMFRTKIEMRF